VFDLAIVDMHMPGMDGLELAHRLHRVAPGLPLVLFSSLGRKEAGDTEGHFVTGGSNGYNIDGAGTSCSPNGSLHVQGMGFGMWGAATGVDWKPRPAGVDGGYGDKMTYDASKYSGSMQKEYLARASTTANALQLGKNAWNAITGAIGKTFLPTIKRVVGVMITVADKVVTFSNTFPKLTAVLVGAAAAVVTFNSALIGLKLAGTLLRINSLGGVVRALVPVFGLARTGILGIGVAMRVVGAAITTTPIGWILAGITLVAGAAYLIYKNWRPIKDFFTGIGTWVGDKLGGAASWISDKFSAAADGVKGAWSTASSWIANRSAFAAQTAIDKTNKISANFLGIGFC